MIGRRMLFALFLTTPAFAGDATAPKLVLETAKAKYAYGELPDLRLAFENETTAPVEVVMPCDGSQHGLRTPSYAWSIERVDGKPIERQFLGLCGTVNPLMPGDFKTVRPDTTLPVPVGHSWLGLPGDATTWLAPGEYRVRITYTWDPSQLDLAMQQAGVAKKIQGCGKLELTSAPVTFEIAKPTEAEAARVAAWKALADETPEAGIREALGEPDLVTPYGEGQCWRYDVGPHAQLTVIVIEGKFAGARAECGR